MSRAPCHVSYPSRPTSVNSALVVLKLLVLFEYRVPRQRLSLQVTDARTLNLSLFLTPELNPRNARKFCPKIERFRRKNKQRRCFANSIRCTVAV